MASEGLPAPCPRSSSGLAQSSPRLGTVYPEFGRATEISAELRRRGMYQQELHTDVHAEPRT